MELSKRLEPFVSKYNTLAEQLADSEVLNNREKYLLLTRQYAELSEIIDFYHKWTRMDSEFRDVKELVRTESDPELKALAESEIASLEKNMNDLENEINLLINPPDPFDGKNVIIEIRAGTGGAEAGLFAADLYRMYARYAENKKWKLEVLSQSAGDLDGIKEVIAQVSGKRVYGVLKYESGVHRVQRVPETEASGRIHTSAVTVAVLPEAEDVEIDIDPGDLRIDVFRSSGPGGQSVNTTDSAVRVTHLPTGMIVSCQDEKSQHKNKAKAIKILKSRLLDKARQEQDEKIASERRQMVSTGDRSAKIRTYNFPQNRITDHRINLTLHRLAQVLEGDLDEMVNALRDFFHAEELKARTEAAGR